MKQFKGRVVVPGTCTAEALVSHGGFNTLASYQMAMMCGDKQVRCGDQNNPDLYKKPMIGSCLLPEVCCRESQRSESSQTDAAKGVSSSRESAL